MKDKGLTLIELVIAVGILLALISLVLGVVRMGLEAARRAQCANNLRQLYLATKLYEEQFGAPPFHPKHHFLAWNPNLAPLLICPSDPYKGYRHKHMVKPEFFVPESYDFIYWGAYHVVRTPPERRRRGPTNIWVERCCCRPDWGCLHFHLPQG
ncbi:MAG: hypothetical protein C4295_05610 [Candidatus Fervidibacterota bacterium]